MGGRRGIIVEKEYQEKQGALSNTSTVRLSTDEVLQKKRERKKGMR